MLTLSSLYNFFFSSHSYIQTHTVLLLWWMFLGCSTGCLFLWLHIHIWKILVKSSLSQSLLLMPLWWTWRSNKKHKLQLTGDHISLWVTILHVWAQRSVSAVTLRFVLSLFSIVQFSFCRGFLLLLLLI